MAVQIDAGHCKSVLGFGCENPFFAGITAFEAGMITGADAKAIKAGKFDPEWLLAFRHAIHGLNSLMRLKKVS